MVEKVEKTTRLNDRGDKRRRDCPEKTDVEERGGRM